MNIQYLLRENLLKGNIEAQQLRRKHMSHCIDYLRRILTCNVDITLLPTSGNTYQDYGGSETRRCRNFDAILQWTDNHKWSGFLNWTLAHGFGHLPPSFNDRSRNLDSRQ